MFLKRRENGWSCARFASRRPACLFTPALTEIKWSDEESTYLAIFWRRSVITFAWKSNTAFLLYCLWPTCSCQQYKTVQYCYWNVIMGFLYTISELQNISYCCQHYERAYVFMGYAVAQLVEALRYRSEGRGFDSRWGRWGFSLT